MSKVPKFSIVLSAGIHAAIRDFLFCDPSLEQMGVILAGLSITGNEVKLLGREFIPVEKHEYEYQSPGGLTVCKEFSQELMQRCAAEGLSQIDVHSHPFGPDPNLWFSPVDDTHETVMAEYIYERLPGGLYASMVMNQGYTKARIWLPESDDRTVKPYDIETLVLAEFPFKKIDIAPKQMDSPTRCGGHQTSEDGDDNEAFSRQILAFGVDGQKRMSETNIAVIGAGGLGSMMIEGLARLGFRNITIIDPDIAEMTNLNRVAGMTYSDAINGTRKADIARKNIVAINPQAKPVSLYKSVFELDILDHLKSADICVVATDNHATRLYAQRISTQYLIPLVSVGVNIEVEESGDITDISGEYAIALPGQDGWCLACAYAYDAQIAAWELADAAEQERWVHRGYVQGADVPTPSVTHLNGIIANLALTEIHNLLAPFKKFQSYTTYDCLASEAIPYTIQRSEDCAICGEKALLALGDIEPIPDYLKRQKEPIAIPSSPPDITALSEAETTNECATQSLDKWR